MELDSNKIKFIKNDSPQSGQFIMMCGGREMIKLCPNGDIFIRGKLAENDKQIVNGFKKYVLGMEIEVRSKFHDVEEYYKEQ